MVIFLLLLIVVILYFVLFSNVIFFLFKVVLVIGVDKFIWLFRLIYKEGWLSCGCCFVIYVLMCLYLCKWLWILFVW